MVKNVILVRHGQAEPASAGTPDALRTLTERGRVALMAPEGFARTFSQMGDDDRQGAELWASSAVRAQQTAQAVASVLGNRPISSKDYLFEQDEATFVEELAASDARCVIVVGHIPFVDRVTEYLTGANLAFHPGAAACIALGDTLEPLSADLLWFVQGPDTVAR